MLWNYILHAAIKNKTKKHTSTWTLLLFHALASGTAIRCEVIAATVRYKQLIHIDSHNIIMIHSYEYLQSVGIVVQDGSLFFFFLPTATTRLLT